MRAIMHTPMAQWLFLHDYLKPLKRFFFSLSVYYFFFSLECTVVL